MAKKKSQEIVALICSSCKSQNYVTTRNKTNLDTAGKTKLILKKYCPNCKKHTEHKETTKLK